MGIGLGLGSQSSLVTHCRNSNSSVKTAGRTERPPPCKTAICRTVHDGRFFAHHVRTRPEPERARALEP